MKNWAILLILFLYSDFALSHKASDSYIYLENNQGKMEFRLDVAIQDFNPLFQFDQDYDSHVQWLEIMTLKDNLWEYIIENVAITSNGMTCLSSIGNIALSEYSDGKYLSFATRLDCPIDNSLDIRYQLLFDVDAQHRGLFQYHSLNGEQASYVFSPRDKILQLDLKNISLFSQLASYFKEGVWHIWEGYDHLLFLFSLLLPAVLVRQKSHWSAVQDMKSAILETTKVVTAFTAAHSITLALVTFGVFAFPISIAESIIAFSIIVSALLNVLPQVKVERWVIGFVFGLIHGFGFASVLSDLTSINDAIFISLLGFNLGVEFGQLAIVFMIFPLAFYLRRSWFYKNIVLKLGSYFIATLGLVWFVERAMS